MDNNIAKQLKEVHKKLLILKNENNDLKSHNQQLKQKIENIKNEIDKKKAQRSTEGGRNYKVLYSYLIINISIIYYI